MGGAEAPVRTAALSAAGPLLVGGVGPTIPHRPRPRGRGSVPRGGRTHCNVLPRRADGGATVRHSLPRGLSSREGHGALGEPRAAHPSPGTRAHRAGRLGGPTPPTPSASTSQTREPGFRRAGDSGGAGESQPSPRGPQTPRPARQGERAGRRTGVCACVRECARAHLCVRLASWTTSF